MSKKALPKRRINHAALALAGILAACQGDGGSSQATVRPAQSPDATQAGGVQASVKFNGKEYVLSLGGDAKRQSAGLPIPVIAGARVEDVIEGVHETSAAIVAAASLAEFMDAFGGDYSARGYSRKKNIMAGGMASAEWLTQTGVIARLYAMEENGTVRARLVVFKNGA